MQTQHLPQLIAAVLTLYDDTNKDTKEYIVTRLVAMDAHVADIIAAKGNTVDLSDAEGEELDTEPFN